MKILRHFVSSSIFLFFPLFLFAQTDLEVIKKRIVDELLKRRTDEEQVSGLINSIRDDGTWPGINYSDFSVTGFQHSRHYSNMVVLAIAYKSENSKYKGSKKVKAALELALKNWVTNDYISDNWWHNQIGTPDNLVKVLLVAGDDLQKDIVNKAQPIISRAHLNASGARSGGDRILIAGILAKNLIFLKDQKKFGEVIKVIEGEIKFSTGFRGMQHDYSFHHRDDRVNNTLSYGLGYANSFSEWAVYVTRTKYAFSDEKVKQLIDYYLDGICKQLVYGKFSDPGVINREISRPGTGGHHGIYIPEKLASITDYRRDELEEIIKIRKGEATLINSFSKFFWQTELYVHQRPGYYTSVRMFSTRNRNMEMAYSSEGLKNHHRGDGTNYISVTGSEYRDIAPVYDWQKIPGTTVLQKPEMPPPGEIQKEGLTDFVGAATDGMYGAVAFDFKSPHDPLKARKSWFFFDEEYVCMGAGITSPANLNVVTTLNQCFLEDEIIVMANNKKIVQAGGEHKLDNVDWIYHNGVAYMLLQNSPVYLRNLPQSGSWYDISHQSYLSRENISIPVFKLWLDHGQRPQNDTYQYIVVPGTNIEDLEKSPLHRDIIILSNTTEIQAVNHNKLGICQAIFYKAGETGISGKFKLITDNPGIVLLKTEEGRVTEITVSDPNRELGRFHLLISGKHEKIGENFLANWNEKTGMSHIAINLPQGVYAGRSVTVLLK